MRGIKGGGGAAVSFVVRVWWEAGAGEWRGQVEHIQSGRRAVFAGWDALPGVLRRLLGEENRPAGDPAGAGELAAEDEPKKA